MAGECAFNKCHELGKVLQTAWGETAGVWVKDELHIQSVSQISRLWAVGFVGCCRLLLRSEQTKSTNLQLLFVLCEQIWTLVRGTSRPRSALYEPTSSASTAAATTRATAIPTSCLWTTVCKVFWANEWTCPRTSKWTTTFGWRGKSSPNLFPGKNCYSETRPPSTFLSFILVFLFCFLNSFSQVFRWSTTSALTDQQNSSLNRTVCYTFCIDWRWRMDFILSFQHGGVLSGVLLNAFGVWTFAFWEILHCYDFCVVFSQKKIILLYLGSLRRLLPRSQFFNEIADNDLSAKTPFADLNSAPSLHYRYFLCVPLTCYCRFATHQEALHDHTFTFKFK